jgi:hypothetical protein
MDGRKEREYHHYPLGFDRHSAPPPTTSYSGLVQQIKKIGLGLSGPHHSIPNHAPILFFPFSFFVSHAFTL